MSGIITGMMAGLGEGIAGMGAAWAQSDARLEEARLKLEARREETLARLQQSRELAEMRMDIARESAAARRDAAAGAGAGKVNLSDPEHRKLMGIADPDAIDKSQFESTKPVMAQNEELGFDAPVGEQKSLDQGSYDKARQGIIDKNVRQWTMAQNPGAFDEQQKGLAQEQVNKLAQRAMETDDPKAREALIKSANELSIALGGKEMYKVSPDGIVSNVATGATRDTETTKAGIAKDKAAANRDNTQAAENLSKSDLNKRTDPNAKKGASDKGWNDMTNSEVMRAYSEARKALKDNPRDKEIRADFDAAQAAYRSRFPDAKEAGSDAAKASPASTPPASALREGFARTFANGQTWTLENGKPKRIK